MPCHARTGRCRSGCGVSTRSLGTNGGGAGGADARALLPPPPRGRPRLRVAGGNVSWGHTGAGKLEDRRGVLERGVERYKPRTGNKVMVVYDGRRFSCFWIPRAGGRTIARIFPGGETADDFIVEEL